MPLDMFQVRFDFKSYAHNFQLDFDDVIAEPKAAHGFDPIWRLSFILFSQVITRSIFITCDNKIKG